jgi:hypothetical protein
MPALDPWRLSQNAQVNKALQICSSLTIGHLYSLPAPRKMIHLCTNFMKALETEVAI